MYNQTIPSEQWPEFFARFSRDHADWTTTIDVLDPGSGPQKVASDVPLQGISFDTKGTRPSSLQISVGERDGEYVRHVIDLPLHVRQAQETGGRIDLQVESARGPTTLVYLREPVH